MDSPTTAKCISAPTLSHSHFPYCDIATKFSF